MASVGELAASAASAIYVAGLVVGVGCLVTSLFLAWKRKWAAAFVFFLVGLVALINLPNPPKPAASDSRGLTSP